MAVARETVGAPEGRCGYVDSRLRELGVEPRRQVTQRTLMGRAGRGRDDALIRTGTLCWRGADLELLKQLVAERRNVLVCGGGGTGKSTVAALLAGRISAARPAERVFCVLERYDQGALGGAKGIVPDPGGVKLLAGLRRGALPECGCLVFDEIYTASGAHSVLEAWRRAVTGIGVLVAVAPEQGDCLGRLALLEEAQPDGFTRAEVLRIYRQARPVIVRTVYPGVIEECGDLAPVPPWMEQ